MFWGAATAAFQIEGAARADGKGLSNWDLFLADPKTNRSGDTGEIACNHYELWREDVALMRRLNLNAYRFSVSWPRVLPNGRGSVNQAGLDFYDRLVDALLDAHITPFVTLFHWDLPQALETEIGGWLAGEIAPIFADYADVVFARLGDRVRHWLTINEPWVVTKAGYMAGVHPPGLRDVARGYRAGHNLLRAHAYAVARFRSRGCPGKIGYALNSSFSFPHTDSHEDAAAAERAVQNFAGWFGDPPYSGDYPPLLRERLGDLLPEFSPADAALLRRSVDFLALNYYTSEVVRHAPAAGPFEYEEVRQPDARHTEMNWPVRPDGLQRLLVWLDRRYPELPMYITENGAAVPDQADERGYVDDQDRIGYLRDHLAACEAARRAGVDWQGYFVWSLLDNLEWNEGFSKRFGIVHCDRKTMQRTIKASGKWYADWIAAGGRERITAGV